MTRLWHNNVPVVAKGRGMKTKGHTVVVNKLSVRGSGLPLFKGLEGGHYPYVLYLRTRRKEILVSISAQDRASRSDVIIV